MIELRGLPRAHEGPLTDVELLRCSLKVRDYVGELKAEILSLNAQLDRVLLFELAVRKADALSTVSATADDVRTAIKRLDAQREAA